jgi:hypothetical protein
MKWDTNNIIAIGLVLMGFVAVTGWVLLSYKSGTSIGTEIPIGIISGLTGVLTGKKLAENAQSQSQTAQALEQVATVATQGQQILNAVDALSTAFKEKKENKQ